MIEQLTRLVDGVASIRARIHRRSQWTVDDRSPRHGKRTVDAPTHRHGNDTRAGGISRP